jgi:integrase
MPRLTDRQVANASPREAPYRLYDEDGLHVLVRPTGTKTWVFRYMRAHKRRDMGLGTYPDVTLAAARTMAKDARHVLSQGHDPIEARDFTRKAQQEAQRAAEAAERAAAANTFRAVAERLIEAQSPGWTSKATHNSWRWTMDTYAFPALGDRPVREITQEEVIAVLLPLQRAHAPTAKKLHRRISAVLDLAIHLGLRTTPNNASPRAVRAVKALPEPPRAHSQPSLPWQKVPAFLAHLDRMAGVAPLALRMKVLTVVRSAEVRGARWNEMDFAAGLWIIPAVRMKGGRSRHLPHHRVPLTPAMLDTLARATSLRSGSTVSQTHLPAVAKLAGNAPIFPNADGGILSDAALSAVLRRMNEDHPKGAPLPWADPDTGRGIVPHGFRRSFRNWVDDNEYSFEAAEKALAHYPERGTVSGAYRSSDLLAPRRALMNDWSDFCTGAATGAEARHLVGRAT